MAVNGPLDVPPAFHQALRQVRNARFQQAVETSRELESSFPEHPLTYLIAAEAYWGMIYCQTGHITARQIWYVADRKTSTYDKEFLQAVGRALEASQQMRLNSETGATGAFYAGLARVLRARLYALREQSLKSASEAKQMRADLLEAIAKDSQLAPDAYLGLGAYNYYADVLSPLLKVIRFFMGIPGGDRRKGLEQLRTASERALLFATEARYEVARIYAVQEKRHSEALLLFRDLSERYPENALYALSAGYQAEEAGQKSVAIEFVQKAQEAAAKGNGVCRERLGEVAQEALERLRGGKPR